MRTTLLRQLRVSERRHGDKYGGAVTPSRGDYPKLLDDCAATQMRPLAPISAAMTAAHRGRRAIRSRREEKEVARRPVMPGFNLAERINCKALLGPDGPPGQRSPEPVTGHYLSVLLVPAS